MLARIQSLYLFVVALLAVASMVLPIWSFNATPQLIVRDLASAPLDNALYNLASTAGMGLSPLTAIVAGAAIFLFTNRALQTKLIMLAMLLFAGDLVAALAAAHMMNEHFVALGNVVVHQPQAGLFILLPEPLLLFLALKGVKTDDKIANAYKRL